MLGSTTDLGRAVRGARTALGLSRAAAAKRSGVGERFLWELENGKPSVQLDKVLAVMNGVGLVAMILPMGVVRAALKS